MTTMTAQLNDGAAMANRYFFFDHSLMDSVFMRS